MSKSIKDQPWRKRYKPQEVTERDPKNEDVPDDDQLFDSTIYGEVIPSLMGWTSSEDQEARASKLEELPDEDKRRPSKDKKK